MLHTRPLISSTHIIHWFNCTCTLNGVALILLHPQFKKTPLPLLYHRIANNLCRHERSALPQSPAFIRLHKATAKLVQHPHTPQTGQICYWNTLSGFSVSLHISTSACLQSGQSSLHTSVCVFFFLKCIIGQTSQTKTYAHTHTLTYSLAPIRNTILLKTTTATLK